MNLHLTRRNLVAVAILMLGVGPLAGSSTADSSGKDAAATATRSTPITVAIDAGHGNFHTADGRYAGLTRLLTSHGYRVTASLGQFSKSKLSDIDVLIIANALHPSNIDRWHDPVLAAFTAEEIAILHDWVNDGGALLLIADHYPFPGAVADLAAVFGFQFENGFAFRKIPLAADLFERRTGELYDHSITVGSEGLPPIEVVVSFTGTGFKIPAQAEPIMRLNEDFTIWLPSRAWEFSEQTRRITADGHFQGATLELGKGRVAVFGEAAMFTDQPSGGFNSPIAPQNAAFVINTLHWLSAAVNQR